MEVQITGHHANVTDSMRKHVNRRLKKIENHFQYPTTTDVILQKMKASWLAEATIRGRKISIHAKSEAQDVFSAVDALSHKLDRQVIKHKERLTDRFRHSGLKHSNHE